MTLHQKPKTGKEAQRILKELSQSLTSASVEELFNKLTEGVRQLLRADVADVRLIEKEGSRIVGVAGGDRYAYRQPRGRRDRWRELVTNPKVLSIPDISKDPGAPAGENTRRMGVRGLLIVPFISRQGQVIGLLRIMSLEPREFTVEEMDQVQRLTNGAAVAVENAWLFEQVRKKSKELEETNSRLNRLVQEQSALREILTQINVLEMDQLLQKIVQQALHLLGVDHVHIHLLTPDGLLQPVAAAGSQAERLMERQLRRVRGRSGWIVKNLKPLVIPDITQDKEFGSGHIMREEGVKSYIGLPLISRGHKPVGVLIAQSKIQRNFTAEEIALAQQFATGAAIAIENATLFDEVRHKTRELEEAYETKSDFLNTMAHELRTPLNVIIGNTQLLQDGFYGPVNEATRKGLETTKKNADSLVDLVTEILELARLEAKRVPLRIEALSVGDLMDEIKSFCTPLVKEKAVRLTFETEDSRLDLRSDRTKIKGILQNLIANAVKYTDQGEIRVEVRTETGRDFVSFSIRDTGIGIKSEDLQRVFEPFYMVDGLDRDKYPGTGLGLSLVQRMVQVLQGEIKVESEPGKGSNFTVFLPRIHPENA